MSNDLDLNKIPKIRNRDDKRKLEKVLRQQGKNKAEIDKLISLTKEINRFAHTENLPKFKECLLEGDKVKLNVTKIKSHPDYKRLQQSYQNFVENNDGVIFTVEYDKNKKDKPILVTLKEDVREIKWLFYEGDLLVFDEKDGKFKELYMIEEYGEKY